MRIQYVSLCALYYHHGINVFEFNVLSLKLNVFAVGNIMSLDNCVPEKCIFHGIAI